MKLRCVVIVLAIAAFAPDVRADESSAAAAQALFKEGRALLQQGSFADACERLARSDRLDPAVGTRLSLGECHEGLGQTASAWAAYNQATALAMQRSDPRAEVAKKRAATLEPKLAKINIRITGAAPELVVKRNGTRVDPAALETTIPVDAGPQSIDASAAGYKPWSTRIEIRDGESKEIRIPALEMEPPSTRAAGETPTSPPPADSRKTLALGLEIGGGVALLAGLVVGGVAISKWSSVEDTCPDGRCATNAARDRLTPEVSTARTLALTSTIVTALGAAALAAGIVIHVTSPSKGVAVVPVVDRQGAGVAGAFRF
jgi:hypothetical protein